MNCGAMNTRRCNRRLLGLTWKSGQVISALPRKGSGRIGHQA